ncbi:hypothetical protein [Tianweitania sediminis]|uniref:hypothetical protein n=1 Tax=Tianweitania sediminis TaxID=1502156 RepID=UPI001ADEF601|nr:hypothetical protein [Tianweitania sediminis]
MKRFLFSMVVGVTASLIGSPTSADPFSSGWKPKPNANRASIASLMLQKEQMRNKVPSYAGAIFTCGGSGGGGRGGDGAAGASAGPGGGSATGTATANNNCSIVVDSKGTVLTSDQVSDGDQSSNVNTGRASSHGAESLSSILESME